MYILIFTDDLIPSQRRSVMAIVIDYLWGYKLQGHKEVIVESSSQNIYLNVKVIK